MQKNDLLSKDSSNSLNDLLYLINQYVTCSKEDERLDYFHTFLQSKFDKVVESFNVENALKILFPLISTMSYETPNIKDAFFKIFNKISKSYNLFVLEYYNEYLGPLICNCMEDYADFYTNLIINLDDLLEHTETYYIQNNKTVSYLWLIKTILLINLMDKGNHEMIFMKLLNYYIPKFTEKLWLNHINDILCRYILTYQNEYQFEIIEIVEKATIEYSEAIWTKKFKKYFMKLIRNNRFEKKFIERLIQFIMKLTKSYQVSEYVKFYYINEILIAIIDLNSYDYLIMKTLPDYLMNLALVNDINAFENYRYMNPYSFNITIDDDKKIEEINKYYSEEKNISNIITIQRKIKLRYISKRFKMTLEDFNLLLSVQEVDHFKVHPTIVYFLQSVKLEYQQYNPDFADYLLSIPILFEAMGTEIWGLIQERILVVVDAKNVKYCHIIAQFIDNLLEKVHEIPFNDVPVIILKLLALSNIVIDNCLVDAMPIICKYLETSQLVDTFSKLLSNAKYYSNQLKLLKLATVFFLHVMPAIDVSTIYFEFLDNIKEWIEHPKNDISAYGCECLGYLYNNMPTEEQDEESADEIASAKVEIIAYICDYYSTKDSRMMKRFIAIYSKINIDSYSKFLEETFIKTYNPNNARSINIMFIYALKDYIRSASCDCELLYSIIDEIQNNGNCDEISELHKAGLVEEDCFHDYNVENRENYDIDEELYLLALKYTINPISEIIDYLEN